MPNIGPIWNILEGGYFGWKQLGRAGRQPPPPFFYKMAFGAEGKGFSTLDIQFSLKISEEKKKEEKNPSQGASVTFL